MENREEARFRIGLVEEGDGEEEEEEEGGGEGEGEGEDGQMLEWRRMSIQAGMASQEAREDSPPGWDERWDEIVLRVSSSLRREATTAARASWSGEEEEREEESVLWARSAEDASTMSPDEAKCAERRAMDGADSEVGEVAEGEDASGARSEAPEPEESAAAVAEERRVRRESLPWVELRVVRWFDSVPYSEWEDR